MNLLSSLRYLVALNEHRHFGRAAQACHITQPALSNALRALEAEFKVVIVKRDRKFVGLTPEGERVLASAQLMLREHAILQQDLSSEIHLPGGPLRIAAVPTAIPILARFAAQLQARHPGIVPVVLSMSSAELEKGLLDLSIDLGLGYTERMDLLETRLIAWPQYTEHYFLLQRAKQVDANQLEIGLCNFKSTAGLPAFMASSRRVARFHNARHDPKSTVPRQDGIATHRGRRARSLPSGRFGSHCRPSRGLRRASAA